MDLAFIGRCLYLRMFGTICSVLISNIEIGKKRKQNMFLSFTDRLLEISNIMFQEVHEIKIKNPHNPKASKTTPLLSILLGWQCCYFNF